MIYLGSIRLFQWPYPGSLGIFSQGTKPTSCFSSSLKPWTFYSGFLQRNCPVWTNDFIIFCFSHNDERFALESISRLSLQVFYNTCAVQILICCILHAFYSSQRSIEREWNSLWSFSMRKERIVLFKNCSRKWHLQFWGARRFRRESEFNQTHLSDFFSFLFFFYINTRLYGVIEMTDHNRLSSTVKVAQNCGTRKVGVKKFSRRLNRSGSNTVFTRPLRLHRGTEMR